MKCSITGMGAPAPKGNYMHPHTHTHQQKNKAGGKRPGSACSAPLLLTNAGSFCQGVMSLPPPPDLFFKKEFTTLGLFPVHTSISITAASSSLHLCLALGGGGDDAGHSASSFASCSCFSLAGNGSDCPELHTAALQELKQEQQKQKEAGEALVLGSWTRGVLPQASGRFPTGCGAAAIQEDTSWGGSCSCALSLQ